MMDLRNLFIYPLFFVFAVASSHAAAQTQSSCEPTPGRIVSYYEGLKDRSVSALELTQILNGIPNAMKSIDRNCESPVIAAIRNRREDIISVLGQKLDPALDESPQRTVYSRDHLSEANGLLPEEVGPVSVCRYILGEGDLKTARAFQALYSYLSTSYSENPQGIVHIVLPCKDAIPISFEHQRERLSFLLAGHWPLQDKRELLKTLNPPQNVIMDLLGDAVRNASPEVVQSLIEDYSLSPNQINHDRSDDGNSLLMLASINNNYPNVQKLIALGADINYREPETYHLNALDYAAAYGSVESAELLIKAGLDPKQTTFLYGYPLLNMLEVAATTNRPRTVKLMLQHVTTDQNTLSMVYDNKNHGCLVQKCTKTLEVLLEYYLTAPIPRGESVNKLLLFSIRIRRVDLIEKYIALGADKNAIAEGLLDDYALACYGDNSRYCGARDFNGVGLAIINQDLEALQKLIDLKANLDAPSLVSVQDRADPTSSIFLALDRYDSNSYPVNEEFKKRTEDMISLLVSSGANKRVRVDWWYTPNGRVTNVTLAFIAQNLGLSAGTVRLLR